MAVKKTCSKCSHQRNITEYYASASPLHESDNKVPVCKPCLKSMVNIDDIESVKDVLRMIDRPFIYSLWISSLEEKGSDKFGIYMKNIGMKDFRHLTWKDSQFDDSKNRSEMVQIGLQKHSNNRAFVVTDDIIERWGAGYTPETYYLFERKYEVLRRSYDEKTAMHSEGLKTYIRYRVKEEQATAQGLVKDAKEWGALAQKAASDAKLNVSQMSKSDISGGVDVISQLFEAVESEVGIIPLLPKLLEQPYDDADLIIWATVNYNRRLEDKPFVSYRDIWNFYDEMLGEYFKQQGFNDKQIKDFKRKRNNVFRDLSDIYKEPLYDSDGEK